MVTYLQSRCKRKQLHALGCALSFHIDEEPDRERQRHHINWLRFQRQDPGEWKKISPEMCTYFSQRNGLPKISNFIILSKCFTLNKNIHG